MHRTWLLLFPELRGFAPHQQRRALHEAASTPLDVVELLALAVSVALVAGLTRYTLVDPSLPSRVAAALVDLAVAVPLIAVCAAPVHVRRLRRGLRLQLEVRGHE